MTTKPKDYWPVMAVTAFTAVVCAVLHYGMGKSGAAATLAISHLAGLVIGWLVALWLFRGLDAQKENGGPE